MIGPPRQYDPAHPDRDPKVLQGTVVLTPEQEQKLQKVSPEAAQRYRDELQPFTHEDT